MGGVYEVVEKRSNIGTSTAFRTAITDGMIVASFHSDDVGSGVVRKNLAKSIELGTRLVLFGVNVNSGDFTSLRPMLYLFTVEAADAKEGDVNLDGTVDMFDCLQIKSIYFGKVEATPDELAIADIDGDGIIDMFDYLSLKARVLLS